jgi:hypothetical protein
MQTVDGESFIFDAARRYSGTRVPGILNLAKRSRACLCYSMASRSKLSVCTFNSMTLFKLRRHPIVEDGLTMIFGPIRPRSSAFLFFWCSFYRPMGVQKRLLDSNTFTHLPPLTRGLVLTQAIYRLSLFMSLSILIPPTSRLAWSPFQDVFGLILGTRLGLHSAVLGNGLGWKCHAPGQL